MVKYLIFGVFLSVMQAAYAETLRDPTMPANQLEASGLANITPLNAAPVLQSVTLGSDLKYAMINGQSVKLGARYGHFILVTLSANKAVLKAADGSSQVLKMEYPIQKTAHEKPLTGKPIK